jgi:hypothetical protein
VLPHLPSFLHLDRITRHEAGAVVGVALVVGGVVAYALLRKRESPEEIELQRRTVLALEGRIIDGSIVGIDGNTEDNSAGGLLDVPDGYQGLPHVLVYRYRIAGVTYECAQDVTSLGEYVRNLRIDLPVQVRYDPRNPGNSILVSETWAGVRLESAELQQIHVSESSD